MKKLIEQALDECFSKMPTINAYKKVPVCQSIMSGTLSEIKDQVQHLADKLSVGIDDFEISSDEYDLQVTHYKSVLKTKEETKKEFIRSFNRRSFKYVYDALIAEGYERRGCMSNLFKKFDGLTVYDMYAQKDFDMLEEYYSLSFMKKGVFK